jgi:hypothetical protein
MDMYIKNPIKVIDNLVKKKIQKENILIKSDLQVMIGIKSELHKFKSSNCFFTDLVMVEH